MLRVERMLVCGAVCVVWAGGWRTGLLLWVLQFAAGGAGVVA